VNLPHASTNISNADAGVPSCSSTPRIGFKNLRILRDIALGQLHKKIYVEPSTIQQAMQIGSSIRPIADACLKDNVQLWVPPKFSIKIRAASVSTSSSTWVGFFQQHSRLRTSSFQTLWSALWIEQQIPLSLFLSTVMWQLGLFVTPFCDVQKRSHSGWFYILWLLLYYRNGYKVDFAKRVHNEDGYTKLQKSFFGWLFYY
jgi:hypothetical protein